MGKFKPPYRRNPGLKGIVVGAVLVFAFVKLQPVACSSIDIPHIPSQKEIEQQRKLEAP